MATTTNAFIDKIVWQSAPLRLGAFEWRAIRYTLPERYGKGLTRSAYQFRRVSQFGSAPELWTDAHDFVGYARYLPNYGLPKQLKDLWAQTGDLITDDVDTAPKSVKVRTVRKPQASAPKIVERQLGFSF